LGEAVSERSGAGRKVETESLIFAEFANREGNGVAGWQRILVRIGFASIDQRSGSEDQKKARVSVDGVKDGRANYQSFRGYNDDGATRTKNQESRVDSFPDQFRLDRVNYVEGLGLVKRNSFQPKARTKKIDRGGGL